MVQQLNAKDVKEKILSFLETQGPSLPIPIAKHLGMSTLFASAFLSEIASEGAIKISKMKVGGSPLYYTPSKEAMLENFSNYLGSKEREALALLKENKYIRDNEQHPAIRVALRGLKDFAFAFKKNDIIYWRYLTSREDEMPQEEIKRIQEEKIEPETREIEFKPEPTPIQKELELAKAAEIWQVILQGMF